MSDLSHQEWLMLARALCKVEMDDDRTDVKQPVKRIKLEEVGTITSDQILAKSEAPFTFLKHIEDDAHRLHAKEHACEAGMKHMLAIKELLQGLQRDEDNADSIAEIVHRIDNVIAKEQENEVLVGVCGGTGVGKTSLLNACLDFDELLPSGQEEAATAVPCRVSYNHDHRPGHEFRAEVYFQEHDTIVTELRHLLNTFRDRFEADDEGRQGDFQELSAVIDKGIEKFSTVWKFDEEQIEQRLEQEDEERSERAGSPGHSEMLPDMGSPAPSEELSIDGNHDSQVPRRSPTLEWIMSLNPVVNKLLSAGVLKMEASTCEGLAKKMKQYLDSTESRHGGDGEKFAVWPLVKEVRVFVRSDMLRRGISLVDLPGIGDNNQARNNVAGQYLSRLHLTIVIASIIRGKDTKDFNDLLGSQQQASMQLDGTLNKDHFAVVFTKIDDMQPDKYQFHVPSDEVRYRQFADHGKQKKAESQLCSQRTRHLEKAIAKAQINMARRAATVDSGRYELVMLRASKLLESLKRQRGAADVLYHISRERQAHMAILARNEHVREGIKKSWQKTHGRQRRMRGLQSSQAAQARQQPAPPVKHVAEILTTSSRGYWDIKKNRRCLTGIPTTRYTGIPELQRWIRLNAALHREGHINDVLADQRVVLELVKGWSQSSRKSVAEPERASPRQTEGVLEQVHQEQLQVINEMINDTCKLIDHLDPLGNEDRLRRIFRNQQSSVAARFVRKFPGRPQDLQNMHWQTYQAIIYHDGVFTSSGSGQSYDWHAMMSQTIIGALLDTWQRALVDGIRDMNAGACDRIRRLWTPYPRALLAKLALLDPGLASQLADLEQTCQPAGASLEANVATVINDLKEKATRMHHDTICPSLREGFRGALEAAAKETGEGSFQRRQDILCSSARTEADELFTRVWKAMKAMLQTYKSDAKGALHQLSEKSIIEVKTALKFRLNVGQTSGGCDTFSRLQLIVRTWTDDWTFPQPDPEHVFKQNLCIPNSIPLTELGRDHPVMTVNEVNYFDSILNSKAGSGGNDPEDDFGGVLAELARL